jgi:hypothetical protein
MPQAARQRIATPTAQQNATKRERAAILLAADELPNDTEIARHAGVHRATLVRWKSDPEFQAMVQDAKGAIIAEALRLPIAKKHERVKELNDLNERYWRIIESRAERHAIALQESPEAALRAVFGDVTPAEAATGMLVAQPKIAANGKTVVEWAFDKALDSAIKETHKQAATELGQWQERTAVEQTTTMVQIIADEDD